MPKQKRKKKNRTRKKNLSYSQRTNFLVVLLSLIVIIETAILLFLISEKTPPQEQIKITKQYVPAHPKEIPVRKKKVIKPIIPQKRPSVKLKAKIAIVIDDWGYNDRYLDILKGIDSPLTLAILPFRPYSKKIAEFAHKNNFEVIIHMPMEPENKQKVDLEPQTLMCYMGYGTVSSIMNEAIKDVPYVKGINNHMGSLATKNRALLEHVCSVLKQKGLYFLDSYVTKDSLVKTIARKIGVRYARRSIFLDNELNSQYIKERLEELKKEARKRGWAIGIGHDRKKTLETLKKEIPRLIKEGYRLVFVSELVS